METVPSTRQVIWLFFLLSNYSHSANVVLSYRLLIIISYIVSRDIYILEMSSRPISAKAVDLHGELTRYTEDIIMCIRPET